MDQVPFNFYYSNQIDDSMVCTSTIEPPDGNCNVGGE